MPKGATFRPKHQAVFGAAIKGRKRLQFAIFTTLFLSFEDMGDSAAQVDELLKEKSRTFCGSAKVWLRQLRAEDVHVSPRQLDPKNVTRLLRIYQLEGCLRLEPEHHIPVIIEEAILESSLRRANVSRAVMRGLGEPMQLDFEVEVTYLHGQHRLAAAQNFLTLDDKWWVADLYLDRER